MRGVKFRVGNVVLDQNDVQEILGALVGSYEENVTASRSLDEKTDFKRFGEDRNATEKLSQKIIKDLKAQERILEYLSVHIQRCHATIRDLEEKVHCLEKITEHDKKTRHLEEAEPVQVDVLACSASARNNKRKRTLEQLRRNLFSSSSAQHLDESAPEEDNMVIQIKRKDPTPKGATKTVASNRRQAQSFESLDGENTATNESLGGANDVFIMDTDNENATLSDSEQMQEPDGANHSGKGKVKQTSDNDRVQEIKQWLMATSRGKTEPGKIKEYVMGKVLMERISKFKVLEQREPSHEGVAGQLTETNKEGDNSKELNVTNTTNASTVVRSDGIMFHTVVLGQLFECAFEPIQEADLDTLLTSMFSPSQGGWFTCEDHPERKNQELTKLANFSDNSLFGRDTSKVLLDLGTDPKTIALLEQIRGYLDEFNDPEKKQKTPDGYDLVEEPVAFMAKLIHENCDLESSRKSKGMFQFQFDEEFWKLPVQGNASSKGEKPWTYRDFVENGFLYGTVTGPRRRPALVRDQWPHRIKFAKKRVEKNKCAACIPLLGFLPFGSDVPSKVCIHPILILAVLCIPRSASPMSNSGKLIFPD